MSGPLHGAFKSTLAYIWWEKPPFRHTQYPDIRGDASLRSVVFVKDPGTYRKVTPEPTGL